MSPLTHPTASDASDPQLQTPPSTPERPHLGEPIPDRHDPVLAALEDMEQRIELNVRDERTLQRRIRQLLAARQQGQPWRTILDEEPEPGALHLVGLLLGRLSESSGVLRRSLARALRSEGETVPAIARRFGVTHQRVSSLLRQRGQR